MAYATVLAMAGLGKFDYPFTTCAVSIRLCEIAGVLKKFREGSAEWVYWSRDVVISPEFARELLSSHQIKWQDDAQGRRFREQASGVWRWLGDASPAGESLLRKFLGRCART